MDWQSCGVPLLAALFDSLPDPVLLCDPPLVIRAVNRAATQLLGVPSGKLVGRKAADVFSGPTPAVADLAIPAPARLEWRCRLSAIGIGEGLLEVVAIQLVDERTGIVGWVLRLTDLGPLQAPPEFIGHSTPAQELLEFTARIAASRARSILLEGESGTGKELIARRLHTLSSRAGAPFVPINCAALPENLLESELFGHEKGAFTGADQTTKGLLEVADGGTLFLDEISELTPPLQAKLLRVLEDQTFRRVGGSRSISVDLRVIGATNVDLQQAIEQRKFRSDLYYRLNVVQVRLPALRERHDDIPELAEHLLAYFNRLHRRSIKGIHPSALRVLELHSWPGNVRELRNVIERAVLVEPSSVLTTSSVVISNMVSSREAVTSRAAGLTPGDRFSLSSTERDLIASALAQAGGNQTRAAKLLGIGRFSLRYRMKKLGVR